NHGEGAEDEVASGVVDEEDDLAIALLKHALGKGIVLIDEPGARGELFSGFEEVGAAVAELLRGGFCAHVEDVAGEDAFDDGAELRFAFEGVELAADGGEEGE